MQTLIIYILVVVICPPAWSAMFANIAPGDRRAFFFRSWLGTSALQTWVLALARQLVWSLVAWGMTLLAAVLWWLSRRRRKRAPRHYGAKSKALLAALVRKAREAARPRVRLGQVPA